LYPVIFRIGPLEIKSYGVMLAISFLVGFLIARNRANRRNIDQGLLLDLCFYILLSAIIGSRAFYVITHWGQYADSPLAVLSIWEGGLSMMGGILLSLTVSWLFLKKKGIPFTLMGDILAPSIALGVMLTRIGCFLYGCCYGLPTDLPWGVQFPPDSAAGSHFGVHIHPAQLYASGYGLLIFGILNLYDRFAPPQGALFGALLALYAPARFTLDFFRYYEPDQYVLHSPVMLTNNQLICAVLFVMGVIFISSGYRKKGGRT